MRRESAAPPTHIHTTSRQQARTLLRTHSLDGILKHQFNSRPKSFAPFHWRIFKENHTFPLVLKTLTKKISETR
jgi:hypothetical protein